MNIDTFHSLRLREEARKSWDYLITNELVYAVDSGKVEKDVKRGYIERYIRSEFYLECTFAYGDCYYVAIVDSARAELACHTSVLNNGLGKTRCELPMFINSIDLVKPPEMLNIKPISSVVRLKTFNNLLGFNRDVLYFGASSTSRFFEIGGRIENGELCTRVRFVGRKECELPSQMVERRAQVKSNITNDYAPRNRRFPVHLKPKDFLKLFDIFLWDDIIWFGFREPEHPDIAIEEIEMFLRPDDFEPNAVQRMHMLYSQGIVTCTDSTASERICKGGYT